VADDGAEIWTLLIEPAQQREEQGQQETQPSDGGDYRQAQARHTPVGEEVPF
jgi:hypothetical protein